MYFKQITVEGMGCLSYLIGCPQAKVACVVDPKRDVQDYINLARDNGRNGQPAISCMQHIYR